MIWQTKEIKKLYLPVKNKINLSTNWKTELKQGAKWGIKQWKQNYKPNHQQIGLPPYSALPIRGKTKKQTQHKSQSIESLQKHWTKLRQEEAKRKKEFNLVQERIQFSLKLGKRRCQARYVKKNNNEKAEKYYANEGTN